MSINKEQVTGRVEEAQGSIKEATGKLVGVRENESRAMGPSDLVAEQVDMKKLTKVVDEAFESVAKVSKLPVLEVMCNIQGIDVPELKQAIQEAFEKIANATDLDTAQITDIFKANRGASVNDIVNRLRKQSRVHRAPW